MNQSERVEIKGVCSDRLQLTFLGKGPVGDYVSVSGSLSKGFIIDLNPANLHLAKKVSRKGTYPRVLLTGSHYGASIGNTLGKILDGEREDNKLTLLGMNKADFPPRRSRRTAPRTKKNEPIAKPTPSPDNSQPLCFESLGQLLSTIKEGTAEVTIKAGVISSVLILSEPRR